MLGDCRRRGSRVPSSHHKGQGLPAGRQLGAEAELVCSYRHPGVRNKVRYKEVSWPWNWEGTTLQMPEPGIAKALSIALSARVSSFRYAAQLSGSRSRCDPREARVA